MPINVHAWYVSEPCWFKGGPDSGRAPVFGFMAANMVESAFFVGRRSFVETNWVGTAMPISPASEIRRLLDAERRFPWLTRPYSSRIWIRLSSNMLFVRYEPISFCAVNNNGTGYA